MRNVCISCASMATWGSMLMPRDSATLVLLQVVESELQRVPAQVARRYSSQLWSMVYIPQVRTLALYLLAR